MKTLQTYRDRLRAFYQQREVLGKGQQRKRHAYMYKVSHDGKYGKLTIDLPSLLGRHRLKASKGGELILDTPVDQDRIDLITKRGRKRDYSALSQKLFKMLTDLSELPIHPISSKHALLECDPKELVSQLELICGSIRAGNDSQQEKINGINIIDKLLKLKSINKDTHEGFYRKYFE